MFTKYVVWKVRRAKIRKDDFVKGSNEMGESSNGKSNGSGGSIVIVDDTPYPVITPPDKNWV